MVAFRSMWIGRACLLFIATLVCCVAFAQPKAPPAKARIAVSFFRIPVSELPRQPAAINFVGALRELGWAEGKNLEIVWHSSEGDYDRLARDVRELIAAKPNVLVVGNEAWLKGLSKKEVTVPVVMVRATDPVDDGYAASLARPGGNVTGMLGESDPAQLFGKRLALLKEAVPTATRVALFHDQSVSDASYASVLEPAARSLGISVQYYPVSSADQLMRAAELAKAKGVQAVLVDCSFGGALREHAAYREMASRYRLPALHRFASIVTTGGGLFSFTVDTVAQYRRAAVFVDRILRGASPATMPFEQLSVRLTVNLKAAGEIGFTFPPSVLLQADEIVR